MLKFNTKIKYLFIIFLLSNCLTFAQETDPDSYFDLKEEAFALYNTNNLKEADTLLNQIPDTNKDEEVYLILANIDEDINNGKKTVDYLKAAIKKNPEFYKAYYNLGCFYSKKKIYSLAIDNFKLAAKYNKKNPYIFYNLACAQMYFKSYGSAKKNFTKAILLKNNEKDFYYNLAFVNKQLGKEKEAKKIIDFYNETFVK